MVRHIIFDMDGLLVNTEPMHYEAWKKVFEKHGASLTKEVFSEFVGKGNDYVAGWLLAGQGILATPEELIAEKTRFLNEFLDKVEPMPYAVELLEKLRSQKGLVLSVASSSQKQVVVRMLEATGILKFFDFLNAGDEVERTKPSPDVY
ncbi:HAD family phosphatase, partial [Candidatus Woesearchaeota archaeon]